MNLKAKSILLDIEGTVSDIDFVKKVLFPYSEKKLKTYVTNNQAQLVDILKEIPGDNLANKIQQLKIWIAEDSKVKPLKKLQGLIWKEGFENQEFKAPLYEDVLPSLKKWSEAGIALSVYSSGSAAAQKLFFSHTQSGDVLHFFKHHFDLEIGSKQLADSYHKICEHLELNNSEVLFLSDFEPELSAAAAAGLKAVQIVRPGTVASKNISWVNSFFDIEVSPEKY